MICIDEIQSSLAFVSFQIQQKDLEKRDYGVDAGSKSIGSTDDGLCMFL